MKKALIVIVILALAGGVYAWVSRPKEEESSQSQSPAQTQQEETKPAQNDSASEAKISYSASGFDQSEVVVKAGGKLTIVNNSSSKLQFDSDPHPEHTDNPELNAEIIAAGESKTITLNKTGEFGVHNHLRAGHKATVRVQ